MLKLIAAVLMLIDHATIAFVPENSIGYMLLRLIGRLSMPIFAYYIALGFMRTKHFKDYVLRIAGMTICAQIPFLLLKYNLPFSSIFEPGFIIAYLLDMNIGWTFICSLMALHYLEKSNEPYTTKKMLYTVAMIPFFFLSAFGDYGVYGVCMVFIFYFYFKFKNRKEINLFTIGILIAIMTIFVMGGSVSVENPLSLISFLLQIFCAFSVLLIKWIPEGKINLPRYFFYIFYPAHLLVLVLIRTLL